MPAAFEIRVLAPDDVSLFKDLNTVFGECFDEEDTYTGKRPSEAYARRLLASDTFIGLVACAEGKVVGGLAAYELVKFEQERSEIYIYDLAVSPSHRRQGVATALIEELKELAASRGAWVIYVQADVEDEPAVALYEKLGAREDVLHFDIEVPKR